MVGGRRTRRRQPFACALATMSCDDGDAAVSELRRELAPCLWPAARRPPQLGEAKGREADGGQQEGGGLGDHRRGQPGDRGEELPAEDRRVADGIGTGRSARRTSATGSPSTASRRRSSRIAEGPPIAAGMGHLESLQGLPKTAAVRRRRPRRPSNGRRRRTDAEATRPSTSAGSNDLERSAADAETPNTTSTERAGAQASAQRAKMERDRE